MPEIQINPFTTQGMIRDPRLFFGRKTEVDVIWGYLRKDANVSIVAERRMGKSSLLWYVKEMAKDHLEAHARVHYLDMELVSDSEDFFSRLAEVLKTEGETVRDLERALANQRLILCIDEFDRTANNFDAFPRDFFAVLRGLSQGPALTLAIATKTPLIDFSASGGMTSPFYNIFPPAPLALGMFTEAEARDLLIKTAARADVKFDEATLAAAIRLAEGYPWRLQIIGSHLIESGANFAEAEKSFRESLAESNGGGARKLPVRTQTVHSPPPWTTPLISVLTLVTVLIGFGSAVISYVSGLYVAMALAFVVFLLLVYEVALARRG